MIIAAEYSFNGGSAFVEQRFPWAAKEVEEILAGIAASEYRTKKSREKTMPGRMLYNPIALNRAIAKAFKAHGWISNNRIKCNYSSKFYRKDYTPKPLQSGAFREMDFIKDRLGVEVQFGKYAFMVYNVCAKMTIFHNMGFIDAGIEIVPVKAFADSMSTGVSYFEQIVWDLENRGVSDIDIPVIVFGIDS